MKSFSNLKMDFNRPIGLVFDVDELLFDNTREIFLAYQSLLDRRRIPLAAGERFPGKDLFEIIENIKNKYGLSTDLKGLVLERRECYIELLKKTQNNCLKGVREIFQFVDQHKEELDIRIAYATSSEKAFIDIILKKVMDHCVLSQYQHDPDQFFYSNQGVYASTCWGEGLKKKPSPMLHEKTIAKLELVPSQCIIFEDSKSGYEAAKDLGSHVVIVPTKGSQEYFKDIPLHTFNEKGVTKLNHLGEFLGVLTALRNQKLVRRA